MEVCMNSTDVFAKRFKQLRTQKELSLQRIAQDLGVTAQSLSLYEKGQRTINIDLLQRVADYFNVSSDYLIGLSKDPCTVEDIKPIIKYTGLSSEALDIIKERSYIINILFKNDYIIDILSDFGKLKNLCRSQRYINDWWGKYDIDSLEDELKLTPDEADKIELKIRRVLSDCASYVSFLRFPDENIAESDNEIELMEYSIQKRMFKLFEYIEKNTENDNEYFQECYTKAFAEISKELQEAKEIYNETENDNDIDKKLQEKDLKALSIEIEALEKWLCYFEKEALQNGNNNPTDE